MKVSYGITLILGALLVSGNGRPVSGQDTPLDLGRAKRSMILYAADPFAGSWRLNVSKSKFSPGPALKSGTIEIEEKSGGIQCVFDLVDADGNARHGEWTAKYDGKDYPAAMTPFADAISLCRVDAHTIDAFYEKSGKKILIERWLVSSDGRTFTMTQRGKGPPAQDLDNTLVYEK